MEMVPRSNDIDRQAAEWAARTDGETLSTERQSAFEAWLAADVRHVGAYAKATAVLAQVERSRAVGMQFEVMRRQPSLLPVRRRIVLMGGIAATLAAVGVLGDVGWNMMRNDVYATSIGETQVVPLSDGSIVTLNTDTKVIVHYTDNRRMIRLVRGEALFDVAKNKARPFIVEAGDTQLRAVGTSFSVSVLETQPVQVLVREGVIEFERQGVHPAAPVRVAADFRASAWLDGPIAIVAVPAAMVERALAWKMGRISFDDQSLAVAAREFARYSSTKIVITDPAVANRTVTGLFVSNDPVGFARAVALSLNLGVEIGDNEVRLTRKKE